MGTRQQKHEIDDNMSAAQVNVLDGTQFISSVRPLNVNLTERKNHKIQRETQTTLSFSEQEGNYLKKQSL